MHYAYYLTKDLDFRSPLGELLNTNYGIRKKLDDPHYRNLHFFDEDTHNINIGSVIVIDNTLGLVTRNNLGETLTMESIELCLDNLYQVCDRHHIYSLKLEDPSWYNPEITPEMVNKYILKSMGLYRSFKINIWTTGGVL